MKYKPHAYQQDAHNFLLTRPHGGLLLPVGLGKTAVALHALMELRKAGLVRRTLVVAPLRALYKVWPDEIRKWDATKDLKIVNLRDDPEGSEQGDIELIHPEKLVEVLERMADVRWDHLIIDEAAMFKDSQTKRFKALRARLHTFKYRWLLNGSPAPNGLIDIWAQAYILDQGAALGRFITHFRNLYCWSFGYGNYQYGVIPGMEKAIYEKLLPLMYRVDPEQAGVKLPQLVHNRIAVDLPAKARKTYDAMEKQFMAMVEGTNVISPNAAAAGMRCRQIANGRLYTTQGEGSRAAATIHTAKIEALVDLVNEMQGRPLLVLYEFQHDEAAIQKALGGNIPNLTTATSPKLVDLHIDSWNKGVYPVMLGHPASMGRALNLQGACSNVCFYGLTWSLDNYEQSIGRVRRQGNEADTVIVHHIVAENTLDDVVLRALAGKAKTQNALNAALTRRRNESEAEATAAVEG